MDKWKLRFITEKKAHTIAVNDFLRVSRKNAQLRAELEAYKKYGFEPCDYANIRTITDREKQCRSDLNALMDLYEQVCAELEQVKREKEAAVLQVAHMCRTCKKCYQCAKQKAEGWHSSVFPCSEWEWRGI